MSEELRTYGLISDHDKLPKVLHVRVTERVYREIEHLMNAHGSCGNYSSTARRMIQDWLAIYYGETENISLSQEDATREPDPELRLEQRVHKRERRREMADRLRRYWVDLQDEPDPEMEENLATVASKYGIDWPPENTTRSDVDPTLRRILRNLEDLWWQDGNLGKVTLRDLQQKTGLNSKTLRKSLATLHQEDKVITQGELDTSHNTVRIISPEAA